MVPDGRVEPEATEEASSYVGAGDGEKNRHQHKLGVGGRSVAPHDSRGGMRSVVATDEGGPEGGLSFLTVMTT
ncbi:BQ2448_1300 [Microbotryum intermedium]|uniref:BQ2448_1300 protein n=1 Tax=Microbotryum intermedium TaxID=269621 RepID=A0A238FFU4_9BASI|nr:BQ2448_1300 [Microbotryum intermedium]